MEDKIFIGDNVKVLRVDPYRSKPLVNMSDDMVRLIVSMPLWLWQRNCKYLGLDDKGQPLKECLKLCGHEGPPKICTCEEN